MSLPSHLQILQKYVHETAELFVAGADLLLALLNNPGRVSFNDWAKELYELRDLDQGSALDRQLEWLWDALRTAPSLTLQFGCLPPAAEPWAGSDERFKVFGAGEWFVIGMKLTDVATLLSSPAKSPLEETVAVQIEQELNLRAGKGGRLECCDCQAVVSIRVKQPYAVSREADIMRIEESRISLSDGIVKVRVNSLNQAYTASSRRLEPNRRSHGGRTYDHVVHSANGKRTLLENIRKQVESGDWEVAPAPTAIGKTARKEPSDEDARLF